MSDCIKREEAVAAICGLCTIAKPETCQYKDGKYGGCDEYKAIMSIPSAMEGTQ